MSIGIGMIGYGYWGPNLVRNFAEAKGARVVSVSDLRPERLALITARYPGIETTLVHSDVLSHPKVDAVVIATPVSTHFELAKAALENGKHVLITKPLTATVEEGLRLRDLAAKKNLTLMVDHTFIYTGAVRKIKEMVDAGFGQVYYYDSVRVNLGLFQHDVNVLWDLAVHDLSIMDHVLAEQPVAVSATGIAHVPGEPENVAYLTCFFKSKLIAHIHVNWLAPVKVRRTLIGGDKQMIVYDDLEPDEKIKIYDKGISLSSHPDHVYQMMVSYRTGDMRAPQLDRTEALTREAAHFLECVTQKKHPITDAESGLRLLRILEAANISLAGRGKPVDIAQ